MKQAKCTARAPSSAPRRVTPEFCGSKQRATYASPQNLPGRSSDCCTSLGERQRRKPPSGKPWKPPPPKPPPPNRPPPKPPKRMLPQPRPLCALDDQPPEPPKPPKCPPIPLKAVDFPNPRSSCAQESAASRLLCRSKLLVLLWLKSSLLL